MHNGLTGKWIWLTDAECWHTGNHLHNTETGCSINIKKASSAVWCRHGVLCKSRQCTVTLHFVKDQFAMWYCHKRCIKMCRNSCLLVVSNRQPRTCQCCVIKAVKVCPVQVLIMVWVYTTWELSMGWEETLTVEEWCCSDISICDRTTFLLMDDVTCCWCKHYRAAAIWLLSAMLAAWL